MTVKEYVFTRPKDTYGKHIRVLDQNKKSCGEWWKNSNEKVTDVKITSKMIFIFIKK